MKKLIILSLFLFATAFAIDYFVKGDEALKETVNEAFANWNGLEPNLEITESETANTTIDYGSPDLFGPDTFSLSVQENSNENQIKVLINPNKKTDMMRVILHETGLLLGLKLQSSGIMNPLINDDEISLGELEITELAKLHQFKKEDINQDGVIDFYDLIELAKDFGQTRINSTADLNKDGKVDNADLEILRAVYSFSAPSPSAKQNNNLDNQEEQSLQNSESSEFDDILNTQEDLEIPRPELNPEQNPEEPDNSQEPNNP